MKKLLTLSGLFCLVASLLLTIPSPSFVSAKWHIPVTILNLTPIGMLHRLKVLSGIREGERCWQDKDCQDFPYIECSGESRRCEHKGAFPVVGWEILGCFLLPLLLGFANIGGIGGGGLIIPVLMALFGFGPQNAVALSNSTIFVAASIRYFMFSIHEKNPHDPQKTLIDYTLASVMMPIVLAGSYLGALANILFPEAILAILICTLLIYVTVSTFKKAIKLYAQETRIKKIEEEAQNPLQEKLILEESPQVDEKNSQKHLEDGSGRAKTEAILARKRESTSPHKEIKDDNFAASPTNQNQDDEWRTETESSFFTNGIAGKVIPTQSFGIKSSSSEKVFEASSFQNSSSIDAMNSDNLDELKAICERERSDLNQWRQSLIALGIALTSVMTNLVRGSPKAESIVGIERCSMGDWALLLAFLLFVTLMTIRQIKRANFEQFLKQLGGVELTKGELKYEGTHLRTLLVGSLVGGLVGAMGLGGGVIFNPLLIGLGVPPQVATSTGMYMIFFSSGASALIYFSFKALSLSYALWLGFLATVGILTCVWLFSKAIKRTNRPSLVVFMLAGILCLSTFAVPYFQLKDLFLAEKAGTNIWAFKNMCDEVEHSLKLSSI